MDAAHQRQTQPGAAVRRQGMIGLWVFLARCCGRGTSLVLPAINAVVLTNGCAAGRSSLRDKGGLILKTQRFRDWRLHVSSAARGALALHAS